MIRKVEREPIEQSHTQKKKHNTIGDIIPRTSAGKNASKQGIF